MPAPPEALLQAMAPSREQIVLAAECLLTWYWLADLGAAHGIPFVLGHALSLKAIHGGKAKNDQVDAPQIAVLLRGGMLPPADVSPAEMRATRDLLRRRMPLARQRGALLAHGQNTNSQYHLPASGTPIADKTTRDGVAERCAAPAGPKSIAVDLARIPDDDARLRDVARAIVNTAKPHDATPRSLLPTVPGMGTVGSLVLLDAIHHLERVPRGQDVASYCRLLKGAKASAGKRSGTSGTPIGQAPLKWAFSEAAVVDLRHHPAGQKCLTRLEKKHRQGQALPLFAHT
jgi:transposase